MNELEKFRVIGADGKEYGPISRESLRRWMHEGRIAPSTLICREEDGHWKPLREHPDLAGPVRAEESESEPPSLYPPADRGERTGPDDAVRSRELAERPPNYLIPAILVTLFCCVPFGIVAIIYAAMVNGRFDNGDVSGAKAASESARMWCWISFGLGLAITIIAFAFGVMSAIAEQGGF